MAETRAQPVRVPDGERFAGAVAYVLGAIPVLLNLDPYINLIGTLFPRQVADTVTVVVLVAIVVLWFAAQRRERGFVRAHVVQMCIIVFATGIVGRVAPREDVLGTGLIPTLVGVVALLGMLWLAGMAWAGLPPSLPWIGNRSCRWGRYERRENT
ncbi:MAG: hypothetical protein EXR64_01495 [Dehalococcoidia bacterium]|nr:hypothetical protein [Dehalococcoidia bacterium]